MRLADWRNGVEGGAARSTQYAARSLADRDGAVNAETTNGGVW